MFCCEQRGRGRKGRERRSQADGRNKWRQSVEQVRGSYKLSTARQPKSSSQSITFSPPLLSVSLILLSFFIPAGVLKACLKWLLQGFMERDQCEEDLVICFAAKWMNSKGVYKVLSGMLLVWQASNVQMTVCRLILLGARSTSHRKMAALIAAILGILVHFRTTMLSQQKQPSAGVVCEPGPVQGFFLFLLPTVTRWRGRFLGSCKAPRDKFDSNRYYINKDKFNLVWNPGRDQVFHLVCQTKELKLGSLKLSQVSWSKKSVHISWFPSLHPLRKLLHALSAALTCLRSSLHCKPCRSPPLHQI